MYVFECAFMHTAQMVGWMDKRMDGAWIDGRMDGYLNGWIDELVVR